MTDQELLDRLKNAKPGEIIELPAGKYSAKIQPNLVCKYWYESDPVVWDNCVATWDGHKESGK